jgi:hypothetical protein
MRISALLLASCVLVTPGVAFAGPCADQIAELSRMAGGGANPATTGATSSPGATASGQAGGTGPAGTAPGDAAQTGTGKQTAEQRSGTREMSAVAGQIATSPEDVRRQQQGRPTTAQTADQATGAGAAASGQAGASAPGDAAPTGTGKQTAEQRSGTREMSAVAGQIATSPEDVRRQQEGRPTTAQASDQLPMARAKLEQARLLDEQGKSDCMALVNEARAALQAK